MRKLFSLFALIAFTGFTTSNIPITEQERKFALDYIKETRQFLLDNVKGLSETQLNWKPADSVWSVANCIEHITIAEKGIFDLVQGALKTPADPSKRAAVKNTDEGVINILTDRSFKAKAPESFQPTGQFGNTQQTLEVYKERRKNLLDYTQTTQDDLRNHYLDFPFGKIDTYQGLLFLAAHSKRHTLQLIEVKQHPDFPKK